MQCYCCQQEIQVARKVNLRPVRAFNPARTKYRKMGVIMGSVNRRHCKEEFARRGDAIYENDVRPQLKFADEGKFAAIDIESGMYEVDRDELKAGDRLRARIPEALIWMVRVGHRSVHRIA
jgi:hypothetical protein